jgi:hypothetical protein
MASLLLSATTRTSDSARTLTVCISRRMAGKSSRLAPLITSFPLQVSITFDMSQTVNGTLFGFASTGGDKANLLIDCIRKLLGNALLRLFRYFADGKVQAPQPAESKFPSRAYITVISRCFRGNADFHGHAPCHRGGREAYETDVKPNARISTWILSQKKCARG